MFIPLLFWASREQAAAAAARSARARAIRLRSQSTKAAALPFVAIVLLLASPCGAASQPAAAAEAAVAAQSSPATTPAPLPTTRLVYLVRHGESYKNTGGYSKTDPQFDSLTPDGLKEAAATGALLMRSRQGCCTAVLSAGEHRCQQTAAAIASALGVPAAEVRTDGELTSKLPGPVETPAQRAQRGLRAVEAFLAATRGDVVVVAHGQIIYLMQHWISHEPPVANADGSFPELPPGQLISVQATSSADGAPWLLSAPRVVVGGSGGNEVAGVPKMSM